MGTATQQVFRADLREHNSTPLPFVSVPPVLRSQQCARDLSKGPCQRSREKRRGVEKQNGSGGCHSRSLYRRRDSNPHNLSVTRP